MDLAVEIRAAVVAIENEAIEMGRAMKDPLDAPDRGGQTPNAYPKGTMGASDHEVALAPDGYPVDEMGG